MRRWLAPYRAGQPPRTANRAAIAARLSPRCTTYLAGELAAVIGAAAALNVLVLVLVLVRMTSVLLVVRVFAWAG